MSAAGMLRVIAFGACRRYSAWKVTFASVGPRRFLSLSLHPRLRQQMQLKGKVDGGAVAGKKPKMSDIRRLFQSARKERLNIAGAVALLAISTSVTMAVPFCMGKVIDIISCADGGDEATLVQRLTSYSKILLGVFVIGGLANTGRVVLIRMAGQRITRDMRQNVFRSVLSRDTAFFDRTRTGELVNRLSADTLVVGEALTTNIADGLRSTMQVAGGMGMMLYVSTKLALLSLWIVPVLGGFMIVYGRYVKAVSRQVQTGLAGATQVAEERIAALRTVRAFAQEAAECRRYNAETEEVLRLARKDAIARGLFFGLSGLAGNIIVLSVFYSGGMMMTDAQLTIGDLSSFLLYAAYTGMSIGGISSFYSELNRALGASSRIWELIDSHSSVERSGGLIPAAPISGHIRFEDVHFAYPARQESPLFAGISLDVPAGSVLAVVGRSGSGKSTLGALLLRLYDPDRGAVLFDGTDVRLLDLHWWRRQVGSVSQEPVLFSCSVAENIGYGVPDVSPARIEEAARQAHALEFVRGLPRGFDTPVGERGVLLSGGQRQRIAIARAIVREPRVLLLDEATSALDAASEKLVQAALETVMKDRTVITIAHRLSTIRSADQVAVLENGRVVEVGSYDRLMETPDGVFRHLVERQMLGLK